MCQVFVTLYSCIIVQSAHRPPLFILCSAEGSSDCVCLLIVLKGATRNSCVQVLRSLHLGVKLHSLPQRTSEANVKGQFLHVSELC